MLLSKFIVNIEDNNEQRRRKREEGKDGNNKPAHHQTNPNGVKRATDDYHYDKFRKQFRRY